MVLRSLVYYRRDCYMKATCMFEPHTHHTRCTLLHTDIRLETSSQQQYDPRERLVSMDLGRIASTYQ